MLVLIIGSPAVEPTTQATLVSARSGLPLITSGELLQTHRANQTDLGKAADQHIRFGELMPDSLIIDMFREALQVLPLGAIIRGYPRTEKEAELFDADLAPIDKALYIAVRQDTAIDRLSANLFCRNCKAEYTYREPPNVSGVCDTCGTALVPHLDKRTLDFRLDTYFESTLPLLLLHTTVPPTA